MHSHDTGRYGQPYGEQVPMPNVQALADQGVLFRQAFCAAPTCSASRACLLTGQYGQSNGMLGLAHRGWSLRDYRQHIVNVLRGAGYTSTLIGEQHISKEPDVIGYDEVMKVPTTHVDTVAPLAMEVLRRPRERPLFVSIGFFETHREFLGPGSLRDVHYSKPPNNLPDTPEVRADMAAFKASARSLDHGVGMVLNQLDACGLSENTLIIFTTDHGMPFPGAKATLYDRGLGVTLILRGPEPFGGGRVIDALVSHIDIYPTVCEYLGIERPGFLQGVSLLPLLRGERSQAREEIFAGSTWHAAYEPQRAVRTRRHKYIRRWGERRTPVLANTDDGPSKDVWIAAGWAEREIPEEQLYDLLFDPNEANNVIDAPAYAEVAAQLRERLERWMRETEDPLLAGHVDPPPGVEINLPDQLSASEPTTRVE
ncbi:MAG TPA: sulfatase [Solirubrobacteraceae bacterium]|nr:sulfatase [Solirubrobacteraceae bacterium]